MTTIFTSKPTSKSGLARLNSKERSNNLVNPNQNICAQKVAKFLGCVDTTRYLHVISDLVISARKKGWTVRSRMSNVKDMSVGNCRNTLAKLSACEKLEDTCVFGYIIRVHGHVIFLNASGDTVVDTAPRKRDRRKITHCYIVYK